MTTGAVRVSCITSRFRGLDKYLEDITLADTVSKLKNEKGDV